MTPPTRPPAAPIRISAMPVLPAMEVDDDPGIGPRMSQAIRAGVDFVDEFDPKARGKGEVLAGNSVSGMRHDQALFGGFAGACG